MRKKGDVGAERQGALEGLFQEFIGAKLLSPLEVPALSHTPAPAALCTLAAVLSHDFLLLTLGFSCFQVTRCLLYHFPLSSFTDASLVAACVCPHPLVF